MQFADIVGAGTECSVRPACRAANIASRDVTRVSTSPTILFLSRKVNFSHDSYVSDDDITTKIYCQVCHNIFIK